MNLRGLLGSFLRLRSGRDSTKDTTWDLGHESGASGTPVMDPSLDWRHVQPVRRSDRSAPPRLGQRPRHRQRKLVHRRRIGPGLPPVGRSTGHPLLGHRYEQEHIACATGLLVPRALPGRGCPRRELPRRLAAGRVGPTPAKVRTPGPGSGIRLACYPADRGQHGPWQHPPGTVVEEEMRL